MALVDQLYVFIFTLALGFILGFGYDLYRVGARLLRLKGLGRTAGDIIFWAIAFISVFTLLMLGNHGDVRFYVFLGLCLGAFIYMRLSGGYVEVFLDLLFVWLSRLFSLLGRGLFLLWRGVTFPFKILLVIVSLPLQGLVVITRFARVSLVRISVFMGLRTPGPMLKALRARLWPWGGKGPD